MSDDLLAVGENRPAILLDGHQVATGIAANHSAVLLMFEDTAGNVHGPFALPPVSAAELAEDLDSAARQAKGLAEGRN